MKFHSEKNFQGQKQAVQQRKSETSTKIIYIKNKNKTGVKLLSIDKYVGNLLSKLAMNSFKSSSIGH